MGREDYSEIMSKLIWDKFKTQNNHIEFSGVIKKAQQPKYKPLEYPFMLIDAYFEVERPILQRDLRKRENELLSNYAERVERALKILPAE